MSANPLNRSRAIAHLPLIVLGAMFLFPLVWLILTSLQPREQVGKIPPEWLPRQHFVMRGSEKVFVTPPEAMGADKVLVHLEDGPKKGQDVLVPPSSYQDGVATVAQQEADRMVEHAYTAKLVQVIPKHFVTVREWRVSKYGNEAPRTFYVKPDDVQTVIEPVTGNYPESVRELTAGEEQKKLGIGELVGRTRFPWTPKAEEGHTITFLTYLTNTLVVAVLSVIGTVLSSALVAYGLSRVSWRGRELLFGLTLATMMVPFPVLMIPLYSVFRGLGWVGTLQPLWVPAFFGSAFSVFLLRQFFMTIPKELSEAARIDGCSEFQIFWRIILPLAKPALTVVALFQFLFVYNDFLGPLIFLTEPETFTMALGLQQYQSQEGGSEWHLLMAASVMLITPVIALFFFTQKTFIQGISTTGMKG